MRSKSKIAVKNWPFRRRHTGRRGEPSRTYHLVFTARQHVMQGGVSHERNVCPSVCQTRGLWQNERKFCPDFYTVWTNIYTSFPTRRTVRGGRPLIPEIVSQTNFVRAKTPIFNRYSANAHLTVCSFFIRFMFNISFLLVLWLALLDVGIKRHPICILQSNQWRVGGETPRIARLGR